MRGQISLGDGVIAPKEPLSSCNLKNTEVVVLRQPPIQLITQLELECQELVNVFCLDNYRNLCLVRLNDLLVEGEYKWSDGTSQSYLNWFTNRPNHDSNNDTMKDCVNPLPGQSRFNKLHLHNNFFAGSSSSRTWALEDSSSRSYTNWAVIRESVNKTTRLPPYE